MCRLDGSTSMTTATVAAAIVRGWPLKDLEKLLAKAPPKPEASWVAQIDPSAPSPVLSNRGGGCHLSSSVVCREWLQGEGGQELPLSLFTFRVLHRGGGATAFPVSGGSHNRSG